MNPRWLGGVRHLFYGVWAVFMTALTYILGAASLKILYRTGGRWVFWGVSLALTGALFALQFKLLGLAFFSLVALVGVFSELEEMGLGLNISAFFTLVINALIAAGTFVFWIWMTGPKWSQNLLSMVETTLKPLELYNPGVQLKYYDLMLQLPSVVIMAWMAALYLAIMLESRLTATMSDQLKDFRVPEAGVWIFILSLLGKFGGFVGPVAEATAANALNVCFMLFFFQGIAVVSRFFEKMRLGAVWQMLFTVLIVVYLFLFVSVLGLADHWIDFRSRLAKGTEEFKREI